MLMAITTVDAMELLDRPIDSQAVHDRLDDLERHCRDASGNTIKLLNLVGGQMDGLLDSLPSSVRDNLERGTELALYLAIDAAGRSRVVIGDGPGWFTTTASAALGAMGGFGGMPGTLAELPVTTTVLLHGIQGVAIEHGFDPTEEGVRFECIQAFAASGPLQQDDNLDLTLLSIRTALTGTSLQALIARVAPRLGTVLGQKLAAQMAPVLGAAAGAAINLAYARHYRRIAHVQFGLRRMAIDADRSHSELVDELRRRLAAPG